MAINRTFLLFLMVSSCIIASSSPCLADYMDAKWQYPTKAIVVYVHAGDLEGDGFQEVVAATGEYNIRGESWGSLYALDRDGNLKWVYDTMGAVSSMVVDDLEGDGVMDMIVGVSFSIHFVDPYGKAQKIFLPDHRYKASVLVVDDLENDGSKELIVAAGASDSGKVYVFDREKRRKWVGDTKGEISAAYVADLEGDGSKEVIVGSIGKHGVMDYPGYVYAYNDRGQELWRFNTDKGVASLSAGDIDGDGSAEVLVGCHDYFYALNSKGKLLANTSINGRVRKIVVTDIDHDGGNEITLGANDVYLLNRDYSRRWVNKGGVEAYDIVVGDLNLDGEPEIMVASEKLYFMDKNGETLGMYSANTSRFSLTSIFVKDISDDGYPEVITGCVNKNVYVLESKASGKKLGALLYYNKARNFYASGDYAQAKENAEEAKSLYSDLGDRKGMKDCEELLRLISDSEKKALEEIEYAQEAYNRSYDAYMARDYAKAYTNAQTAKYKYLSLGDTPNVERCKKIIGDSAGFMQLEAENLFANATSLLESGDYESALACSLKAEEYYGALKDEGSLNKTIELTARIREKTGVEENGGFGGYDIMSALTGFLGNLPAAGDSGQLIVSALAAVAALLIVVLLLRIVSKRRGETGKTPKKHLRKLIRRESGEDSLIDELEREMERETRTEDSWKKEPLGKPSLADAGRKHLGRIMKDRFKGEGVSLKGLSSDIPERDLSA